MSSNRQAGTGRTRRAIAGVLGLVTVAGLALTGSAAAGSPAAEKAQSQPMVAGTPCTATAKACVDLDSQQSWLLQDGKITRGPIKISSGGNGEETPIGHSLRVYRKEAEHKSQESRLPDGSPAPMPWSVFFQDGGIAFHSGDPARSSAGCIHVPDADAKAYFDYLQIGDQVQVVRMSEEKAARGIK
ncbi:MAG: L,D-transpeptidase [Pseudonocardia sp.]|nr:L,D-transpeptidase [Pseudonocardia sp.]